MGTSSIDWAQRVVQQLIWILGVFVAALVGHRAGRRGCCCARTVWGRQFRRLAGNYFRPGRESAAPGFRCCSRCSLLFMTVAGVRMSVLFSYWANDMLTSLQMADAPGFWTTMFLFLPLAGIWIVYQLLNVYATGVLTIKWRIHTNDLMVDDWLRGEAYQRGQLRQGPGRQPGPAHPGGRARFVSNSIALVLGAIGSLVSLVSFSIILWQLSGPIPIFGIEIPRAMMFIAYIYVIVASVVAFRIGRPLIRLNFLNELLTGSFRYALVRLRDASESVAFYRGAQVERGNLDTRFQP